MEKNINNLRFKKALSLLLVIIMLISILPVTMGAGDVMQLDEPEKGSCELCVYINCEGGTTPPCGFPSTEGNDSGDGDTNTDNVYVISYRQSMAVKLHRGMAIQQQAET